MSAANIIEGWVLVRERHELEECEACGDLYCVIHYLHFDECPCVTEFQIDSEPGWDRQEINGIKWARRTNA